MTTMMNVGKLGNFNLKDTLNASYITTLTPHVENNNTRSFMEEFQKMTADDRSHVSIKDKEENNLSLLQDKRTPKDNPVNPDLAKDSSVGKKINQEKRQDFDDKVDGRGPKEKKGNENPNENGKIDKNSKDIKEKTENSKEQTNEHKIEPNKAEENPGGHKSNRVIKETIIRKTQIQQHEMIQAKDDIKENFSASKKISSNDHAEKVMLKDQDANTKPGAEENGIKGKAVNNNINKVGSGVEKTSDVNTSDEKTSGEPDSEKKQVQESDTNKNDGKSTFTNDLISQKNDIARDSTNKNANINLVNDFSKNLQQLNGLKVKQVFSQNNLLDQYQVFREKITSSVESSIKFLISSGDTRATIQLHPPELGRVQVELVIQDNQVSAKINTENAAVKEVIMTNLDQLKSNLANAGTQINKFDVEVGGFKNHFEQNFSQGKSGNGRQQGNTDHGASQDSNELMPDQVWNQQALTFYLGRSINCLI